MSVCARYVFVFLIECMCVFECVFLWKLVLSGYVPIFTSFPLSVCLCLCACVCAKSSTRSEQKHVVAFPRCAPFQRTAPSVFPKQPRSENYCSSHLTPASHIRTPLAPSPRRCHYMCHYLRYWYWNVWSGLKCRVCSM